MLESTLQKKCIALCKTYAILAVKVDASQRGFPDLTLILPNGVVLFVELKTETGVLSALQKRMINKINENKGRAYVIRSETEFIKLITKELIV